MTGESLDVGRLARALASAGAGEAVVVHARASGRRALQRRPVLGRRLQDDTAGRLRAVDCDLAVVLVDGLVASEALSTYGPDLVGAVRRVLPEVTCAPPVIARHASVAIGDRIGELLVAEQVLALVAQRGAHAESSSLTAYVTYGPRPGRLDAERGRVAMIGPPDGLDVTAAADRIASMVRAARRTGRAGIPCRLV
jgi:ethanolamine ammonia-lyase small subunit